MESSPTGRNDFQIYFSYRFSVFKHLDPPVVSEPALSEGVDGGRRGAARLSIFPRRVGRRTSLSASPVDGSALQSNFFHLIFFPNI